MAFQACARAVLTKRLGSRALFPRMQHVVVYATSPALSPPKLDLRNSTSSRILGSRLFSFTFLTMSPESIYLNAKLLYNVLDAAYGAEIRETIILLWKYAPIRSMLDCVISAGQIKVYKAEVEKINEKIGKLPQDTVKQLIVQMDKLGMNETLRVTGLDKIKADFEKNMADFEKSKDSFDKYMAALDRHLAKFVYNDSEAVEPCIELEPQDVNAAELAKTLGADTILIIPIKGKVIRKKAATEGKVDGLDGPKDEDGKNADGLDGTNKGE